MRTQTLSVALLGAVLLSGCSSAPRQFTPVLATPPADQAAYGQTLADCRQVAAKFGGKRGGDVALNGAGTAAAGTSIAGAASWGATAAAGAVAVVGVPVAGIVFGITRANRAKKESRIKAASTQCLSERGYTVAGWEKARRPSRDGRGPEEPRDAALAVQ